MNWTGGLDFLSMVLFDLLSECKRKEISELAKETWDAE